MFFFFSLTFWAGECYQLFQMSVSDWATKVSDMILVHVIWNPAAIQTEEDSA